MPETADRMATMPTGPARLSDELAMEFVLHAQIEELRLSSVTQTVAKLTGPVVEIVLSYDPIAFELEASVGTVSTRDRISAFDLARFFAIEPNDGLQVAHNEAELRDAIGRLAVMLHEPLKAIIADPQVWFARLVHWRAGDSVSEASRRSLERIINESHIAWRNHDWQSVVRLLAPVADRLPEAERRRLAISRRRFGTT